MIVTEKQAKTILSRSKIFDYVINPYTGCQHGCTYCYARFMNRVTGHREAWGSFVDVKVNASDLLEKELVKKQPGKVWVSGVCDPYQPLEKRYQLTRRCLEILVRHKWPMTIQTRSPLVLRDLDIIKSAEDIEVGFSVTTADDAIRKLFEPAAPAINERINALAELHEAGIRTFAMIAPLLPGAEGLADMLRGKVDYVIIDRMNYHYADRVYQKYGLEKYLSSDYYYQARETLSSL